jgi:hypothetical protein
MTRPKTRRLLLLAVLRDSGMYAGMVAGPGKDFFSRNSGALHGMIYNQPVSYELEQIKAPAVLIIGQEAARRSSACGKPDRRQNLEPSLHPT